MFLCMNSLSTMQGSSAVALCIVIALPMVLGLLQESSSKQRLDYGCIIDIQGSLVTSQSANDLGVSSEEYPGLSGNISLQSTRTCKGMIKENDIEAVISTYVFQKRTLLPSFQFFQKALSQSEIREITNYIQNFGLGPDPSSAHFLERTKNIRYIRVLREGFTILNTNHFIQSEHYNDFSGGYRRNYELIPNHLILGPMFNLISFYINNLKIPANTIMLVNLQSSIIRASDDTGDITGQGIHTDGADDSIFVCIERDNIQGAENQFHASLDGTQLLGSTTLEAGNGVLFKDNKIFHYVTKATTTVSVARRTMLIIVSPWDADGNLNPNNVLGRTDAEIQLRNYK